ncbi:hypothetical protein N7470_002885 [Penicillium chermesinum]|nr:hypothetical protein N7470_002885 [Penicillium chermesinum]
MAVILCSYCFISIRSARRDAQVHPPMASPHRGSQHEKKDAWIQQALEESRSDKGGNTAERWLLLHMYFIKLE